MIFDTDILIWAQRGNLKAAELIENAEERHISIFTYMELLQGAKNRNHHLIIKNFLKDFNFKLLPLTENTGHRAAIYIEEYALSGGLRAGDAVIAATSVENGLPLCSSNIKHYKHIKDLDLIEFKPAR